VLAGLLSIVPLLALGCLALTLLFIFRDDLLASLMSRQAEMAAMRTQIEQMKSRELVQEQAYSGRLHELFQRQTQLETRATLVASLAQRAGMAGDVTGEIPRPSSTKAETPSTPATPRRWSTPSTGPRPSTDTRRKLRKGSHRMVRPLSRVRTRRGQRRRGSSGP